MPPAWPAFKQALHRQELMDDMMQATTVDILAAIYADHGQAFVRARAKCRGCLCEGGCRNWLLESGEGLPPDFCPNADFLRACKLEGD